MNPQNPPKILRGFAVMSKEQRRAIARKGGLACAKDPGYMAKLGSRGGAETHRRYKFVPRTTRAKKGKK